MQQPVAAVVLRKRLVQHLAVSYPSDSSVDEAVLHLLTAFAQERGYQACGRAENIEMRLCSQVTGTELLDRPQVLVLAQLLYLLKFTQHVTDSDVFYHTACA